MTIRLFPMWWALALGWAGAADERDEWPMLAHDAARSGATAAEIRPPFARKWYRLFPAEGIQSGVQPVIAGGRLFLGTLAGILYAIDADTGRTVWDWQASGPILHTAAAGLGKVFFGSADGKIQALNAADGKPAWSVQTASAVWNAPALCGNLVLIGSRDGRLYALDAATGGTRWTADTGAPLLNSPAVDARAGRVYIGSETMRVHAYELSDGRLVWTSDPLPGASLRGYHPVIAPDGSILVTTAPVIGYDRFQALMLDMVREVFGDFASWRHPPEENARWRAENFRLMEKPETYPKQLAYLRRRLTEEPVFQTFFVLDPRTGRQRFVAPIVASESMNGPAAPPVVTPDGRVIVKYQVLLRSRYEHYSPFLNVGYLDTATGEVTPIMDQTRTYGWHDGLLLVHDEQSQLSVAGRLLLNTHQDNVNAMDLDSLQGYPEPFALNIHEPAAGEALAIRLAVMRGANLPPGDEWLIRGTAVYGGGSALDVPVAVAGDSFYYLPTHEINSGCALIAYRSQPGAPSPKKTRLPASAPTAEEWRRIQEAPWDWDTLATPRLTNLLQALPGAVPGTLGAPLTAEAERTVAAIADAELDDSIWKPVFDPAAPTALPQGLPDLIETLRSATRELIRRLWRPLIVPAGKAPEEAHRYFTDPAETVYTLLLARPFLDPALQRETDRFLADRAAESLAKANPDQGDTRTAYDAPTKYLRLVEDSPWDDLAQLYPLWLWSRTPAGAGFAAAHWGGLRNRIHTPPPRVDEDCGNGRLAGLLAYCRLARAAKDQPALDEALPATRQAIRARLIYELSYTRGGLIRPLPGGRAALARWRHLSPDVARLLHARAGQVERDLMARYVDHHRPGWWLAWNVEQLMRNEVAYQLPSTSLEIFAARALIMSEPAPTLSRFLDIPWCRADEFYVQKIALILRNAVP